MATAPFELGQPSKLRRVLRHGDLPWSVILIGMCLVVLLVMIGLGWSVWSGSADSRAAIS